jgi:hypothetical protein
LIINLIVDQLKSLSIQRNLDLTLTSRALSKTELKKVQSGLVFDEDQIMEEALKYQTRAEWMRCSPKTYRFALRHGLADIATRHMKYIVEHGKWTKEAVIESAKKYQTLMDWRLAESSAFVIACRNGWLNLARSHFTVTKQPNGYWTKERVIENAKKYNKLSVWRVNESSARTIVLRNGWMDEATAHMKKRVNRKASGRTKPSPVAKRILKY